MNCVAGSEDQIQHTTEDIKPALALLEACGLLVRDGAGLGQPRSGQLPTEADEAAEGAHGQGVVELAKAIIRALTAGNGRSALCDSEPELITRLDEDGVGYNPEDLPAALALLGAGEVPGLVYRLRRPMRYDSHPSTSPGRHGP